MKTLFLLSVTIFAFCCLTGQKAIGQVALYDNMDVLPLFQFDNIIGLRFDHRTEPLAQQFLTGQSDNVASVRLLLQRVGTPTGDVAIEIWDDAGDNVPASLVGIVGTFDVASLSNSEPQQVTIEGALTGLVPESAYYVVLNNRGTDISSPDNSYHFGQLGRVDDLQDTGTNGAEQMLGSPDMGASWISVNDLLGGCHPSGACANYLRMSVMAVPEPAGCCPLAIGALLLVVRRSRQRNYSPANNSRRLN